MINITSKAKNVLNNLIKKENGKAAFLYLKGGAVMVFLTNLKY